MHARALEAPFFHVRKRDDREVVAGQPSCALGNTAQAQPGRDADPFASWSWNGRRLTVRNDRYGFYPLFYYSHDGAFAVSPSVLKLLELGAPTELDLEALGVMLRLNFWVGEDTPFRAIRLVPPNATMFWENGKLTVDGRYLISAGKDISREAALDGYIDLFRAAMRRRPADGPAAVPLSGGRDSRHIFLELCDSGRLPACALTVRYETHVTTQDVDVAAALAARAGVSHVVLESQKASVEGEWEKNVLVHLCALEHGWIPQIAAYLNGKVSVVYEGVAGDWLSTSLQNNTDRQKWIEEGRFDKLADSLLSSEGYLAKAMPAAQYAAASREAAKAKVEAELRKHAGAANPLGSFFFWNRARRITGLPPLCILNRTAKVWCPYLDADLFDFLATLPARLLFDPENYHRFHTDAIYRGYPAFADIPFSAKWAKYHKVSLQRKLWKDTALAGLMQPRSILLNKWFLFSRLAATALDSKRPTEFPALARLCLYLMQLEAYQGPELLRNAGATGR
jgi:asparagine synthase (glutamine-hydrolysing)